MSSWKAAFARSRAAKYMWNGTPSRARSCAMANSGVTPIPPANSTAGAARSAKGKQLRGSPTSSLAPSGISCISAEPPRPLGSLRTPIT